MKKFLELSCLGVTGNDTDEMILFCYGPRRGLRACESASPENMRKLRDQIDKELPAFQTNDR